MNNNLTSKGLEFLENKNKIIALTKNELNLIKLKEKEMIESFRKIRKKLDFVRKWERLELEKYKKIIEHMSESVWIWDENEKTVYANPNFCKLLGYELEEIIWIYSYYFRTQDSVKTVMNNNVKRTKWEASKYEWVLKRKDGTLIPVLCSWTPIPWWGTVWIMTDLRQLKTLESAKEELKNINKVKDEFISIVWHELRTPLTIIKWYLWMVFDGDFWDINPLLSQALRQTLDSTESLIWIVNDMLDLSKIESWKMVYIDEEVDIVDSTYNIYSWLKLIADQKWINLEFIKKWDLSNSKIFIDPNKYKQVIINIVNNALKFTNKWGFIKIILTDLQYDIKIEIQDSWIWMSKEQLEKIFHKFYQVDWALKRNTEWLWLWLSIIQWIIHNYNSEIFVESEEKIWTKFHFSLPKLKI